MWGLTLARKKNKQGIFHRFVAFLYGVKDVLLVLVSSIIAIVVGFFVITTVPTQIAGLGTPLINFTDNTTANNTIVELGTSIIINLSSNESNVLCIDINHPAFGKNYSCAVEINETITITYFNTSSFNDSTYEKNFTYGIGGGNFTLYVDAHQYDEIVNLTLNISGYSSNSSYPAGVKIFLNGTESNDIGFLFEGSDGFTDEFNDTDTTKLVSWSSASTQTVGYFRIPKGATVTDATFQMAGTSGYTYQENANTTTVASSGLMTVNYTKPASAANTSYWRARGGFGNQNYTIPNTCWDYSSSWIQFRTRAFLSGDGSLKANSTAFCYNGSDYIYVDTIQCSVATESQGSSSTGGSAMHDASYSTFAIWRQNLLQYVNSVSDAGCGVVYEEAMYWQMNPQSVWVEVGFINGTKDFQYDGIMNATKNTTGNFSGKLNTFLSSCTADSEGYCHAPVYIYSLGGTMNISNISINYSFQVNPVQIAINTTQEFLNNSVNYTEIPITIQSTQQGTIIVNDLRYYYRGGSKNYTVTGHTTDYSANSTLNYRFDYSRWNYSFPPFVEYIEIIPRTSVAKNVTAFGQLDTVPLLNITMLGYGGLQANFSIYFNETHSCTNLTYHTNGTKANGTLASVGWNVIDTNVTYQENIGIWLWADLNCNYSAWRRWQPQMGFRMCANGSLCDAGT